MNLGIYHYSGNLPASCLGSNFSSAGGRAQMNSPSS
jgi:hypothetical protein